MAGPAPVLILALLSADATPTAALTRWAQRSGIGYVQAYADAAVLARVMARTGAVHGCILDLAAPTSAAPNAGANGTPAHEHALTGWLELLCALRGLPVLLVTDEGDGRTAEHLRTLGVAAVAALRPTAPAPAWRAYLATLRQAMAAVAAGVGSAPDGLPLTAGAPPAAELAGGHVADSSALPVDAPVVLRERRQVQDLPPVRLVVTEHQALRVRCPACQAVTAGTFPAEVPSRAQYGPRLRALSVYLSQAQFVPLGRVQQVLREVTGVRLGRGTLVSWIQHAAHTLEPVEERVQAALRGAPVLHSDETGVRRGGTLVWTHVASTDRLTHYAIHAQRGTAATDAIGILPAFRGVSVHDGFASYRTYTACRHALCNVHHLRELTFLEAEYQQAWAKDLKDLLREMRETADQARDQGLAQVPPTVREPLYARYRALLATGLAANPPPEATMRRPGQRGRLAQSPARNLLERLLLDQEAVLAFLDDLAIPFDNNQAERDLRGFNVHQKVSNGFRSDTGAAAFARIRGYLATVRKQGYALLAALETVVTGRPLYPAFA